MSYFFLRVTRLCVMLFNENVTVVLFDIVSPGHRCFASRVSEQKVLRQKCSALKIFVNADTHSQPSPTPPSGQSPPLNLAIGVSKGEG